MSAVFPFLTTYDPVGTSEGSLDPLGLYRIADQLAIQLVPVVRERMQRIRFLTAIALGSLVTENLERENRKLDASPYLVWEWLLVEALVRDIENGHLIWGVPGTEVTRKALSQYGYVDARSYLKTPRVFGFHGVYKRLAFHFKLVDIHLSPGSQAERLADAWARDQGFGGLTDVKPLLNRWTEAVRRSIDSDPPRTKRYRNKAEWSEFARFFNPDLAGDKERKLLRELLLTRDQQQLGALPHLWDLQGKYSDDKFSEEKLHTALKSKAIEYRILVEAIRAYEIFARELHNAFEILRVEASRPDSQGYVVPHIARNDIFYKSVKQLDRRFRSAYCTLSEVTSISLQNLFSERFDKFAGSMDPQTCALAICEHHEEVQKAKSVDGKRPWFDRVGDNRIYIRQAYRTTQPKIERGQYLHDYRGWPIRRFWADLA